MPPPPAGTILSNRGKFPCSPKRVLILSVDGNYGAVMPLTLYSHTLASFCHKVLIALYENETPVEQVVVDFSNPRSAAAMLERWPAAKIPVLYDSAGDRTIPETSVIIEYLAEHYPGPQRLLPDNPDARLDARLWDRFF